MIRIPRAIAAPLSTLSLSLLSCVSPRSPEGPIPVAPHAVPSDVPEREGDAGRVRVFGGTPLEADRLSRLMLGKHPACTGPLRKLSFTGFPGPYRATVEVPEECYETYELDEIRSTILRLNTFAKVPVKTFRFADNDFSGDGRFGAYDSWNHAIDLTHEPMTSRDVPRIEGTKSQLAHERGHAIYKKGFWKDQVWEKVYYGALVRQNYEIIDDSNYVRDCADDVGHPSSNANEAFASYVNAYFLHADQFAAYIKNENTPPSMKVLGKAVWAYMRDRVFRGFVFTENDADPFAADRVGPLLNQLPGKRESLLALFQDPDVGVRRAVAFDLDFHWNRDAENEVPALTVAIQDPDKSVRSWAMWALMAYGHDAKAAVPALIKCLRHEDPLTRQGAAHTLSNIGPEARAAAPTLQIACRDPDTEVSEAARSALKEILPR